MSVGGLRTPQRQAGHSPNTVSSFPGILAARLRELLGLPVFYLTFWIQIPVPTFLTSMGASRVARSRVIPSA
jgi:hypothetical protein